MNLIHPLKKNLALVIQICTAYNEFADKITSTDFFLIAQLRIYRMKQITIQNSIDFYLEKLCVKSHAINKLWITRNLIVFPKKIKIICVEIFTKIEIHLKNKKSFYLKKYFQYMKENWWDDVVGRYYSWLRIEFSWSSGSLVPHCSLCIRYVYLEMCITSWTLSWDTKVNRILCN